MFGNKFGKFPSSYLSFFPLSKLNINLNGKLSTGYGYLDLVEDKVIISYTKNNKIKTHTITMNGNLSEEAIRTEIKKLLKGHKIIATGYNEDKEVRNIVSSLWLEDDIVSVRIKDSESGQITNIEEHLKFISSGFDHNNIANIKISSVNEVQVTDLITLENYKKTVSKSEFESFETLAKKFSGKSLAFINATPQGGGVALMRHALIRFFRLMGVNVHWYILKSDSEVFNITKRKFHNILQNVAEPGVELTEEDKLTYNRWIEDNVKLFENKFKTFDVIVIDDPQPAGLIPYIKKINPKAKIIYRSHIQIVSKLADKKDTPQNKTWEFLWKNIKLADAFVSHPVPDFVPSRVPKQKLVYMPATTDPLDGLNKELSTEQMNYYYHLFNKYLKEVGQTPLDTKRPYIIQIARFDPSKGIPDVLDSYYKLCEKLKQNNKPFPQLVITGNSSVDDPDRGPIFFTTMNIVNSPKFSKLKKEIKVVPLPHIDQLLNTLLRGSKVALQLSIKEGFEIKVTEALMKGKPIIAYKSGGIPLQIKDGIDGFLVKSGDTDKVAKHLYDLLTNEEYYRTMSKAAEEYYDRSLMTIPNAIRWLDLSLKLIGKK